MTGTLTRTTLRTSLSLRTGHYVDVDAPAPDPRTQPLGYLYSGWDPRLTDAKPEDGFYDPDTQTWISPDGVTFGVYTRTCTWPPPGCFPQDNPIDDSCW